MEQNLSSFSEFSIYPFLIDEKDDCFLTQFLSQQDLMHEAYTFQSHQSTETKDYTQMSSRRCSGKSNTETNRVASKKKTSKKTSSNKPIPRKRKGKKDRHSKIYTARGPRDRRMRLSLQVAGKFFDLQDMLGFDKASKTIEWLFLKSMAAIKELKENFSSVSPNNVSSISGCDVVSEIGDIPNSLCKIKGIRRENKCRKLRVISRESRDKARARAKERTRGKLMKKGLPESVKTCDEENPNRFDEIGLQSEETNPLLKRVIEIDGLENDFLADQTDSWNGFRRCISSLSGEFRHEELSILTFCFPMISVKSSPGLSLEDPQLPMQE